MTPDSIESRLARLEQRVEDHEADIRAFAPLVASQAVLEEQMTRLREDVASILRMMKATDELMRSRDESRADYSTKRLIAIIAGASAVIAAVITAAATIIANAP